MRPVLSNTENVTDGVLIPTGDGSELLAIFCWNFCDNVIDFPKGVFSIELRINAAFRPSVPIKREDTAGVLLYLLCFLKQRLELRAKSLL